MIGNSVEKAMLFQKFPMAKSKVNEISERNVELNARRRNLSLNPKLNKVES
jgi:hypothetical protein